MKCRYCKKFTRKRKRGEGRRLYCDSVCYGLGQRGKSRADRTSPAVKPYIQIRNEFGEREYFHRFVYRQEFGDIPEGFVVHHKNERKTDNSPGNLETKPRNEHTPNEHWHWKTRNPDGSFIDAGDDRDYPGKDGILF